MVFLNMAFTNRSSYANISMGPVHFKSYRSCFPCWVSAPYRSLFRISQSRSHCVQSSRSNSLTPMPRHVFCSSLMGPLGVVFFLRFPTLSKIGHSTNYAIEFRFDFELCFEDLVGTSSPHSGWEAESYHHISSTVASFGWERFGDLSMTVLLFGVLDKSFCAMFLVSDDCTWWCGLCLPLSWGTLGIVHWHCLSGANEHQWVGMILCISFSEWVRCVKIC